MLQAAEQAWQIKDFQQNLEILERASRLDPANSVRCTLPNACTRFVDYKSDL